MGLIYHYCSLETFTQIIKNKTIRLSDLDKTNDYMEKRWGIELLQEALKKELENNSISMDLQEDYWYSDDAHNHIEQLNNDINLYLNHQTLIACFSLEKDQLSQWRAYGQDGEGMAIGFDYDCLKRLLKDQKELLISNVAYKKDDQEKLIRKKMFMPALEYMRDMFQRESVRCSDDFNTYFVEEFDCFCEVLDTITEQVFTFLKNPAFEEEKEVRIVYNTGIYDEIETRDLGEILSRKLEVGKNKELILQPIQHQVKGNKLVAYTDLNFKNCIASGIIKEIVIGPKSKVSEKDANQFLLSNGFWDDIWVRNSKASYR
jgi:hypothetical protein